MSKCTLLVDGNWLLLSRAFAIGSAFDIDNSEETKKLGQANLEDTLSRSLIIALNRFNNVVDNVIIVADGGSWRKKLEVPSSLIQDGVKYKGNREEGYQKQDFTYIFNALNNFISNCETAGMTVSRGLNIEGDDWIWYWSRKLNEAGTNCIIWSSDNDLKQLVQSFNGAFTAWYNDKKGLCLHESLQDKPLSDLDFMLTSDYGNPLLDRLRSQVKTVEYINPDYIIEEKIILGDVSDNIKSVVHGKKGERNINTTSNEWERIKEALNISSLSSFFDNSDKIITNLLECKRLKDLKVTQEVAREVFDYNTRLVWLHRSQIPVDLLDIMDKVQYKHFDVSSVKNNYKVLSTQKEQINEIESLFNSCI